MFFQTLVMASPFAHRALASSYRYVQWPAGSSRNAQVLAEADVERIRASGAHFCRKLEGVRSATLRARLDACATARDGLDRADQERLTKQPWPRCSASPYPRTVFAVRRCGAAPCPDCFVRRSKAPTRGHGTLIALNRAPRRAWAAAGLLPHGLR
jgi:hypothetical protein